MNQGHLRLLQCPRVIMMNSNYEQIVLNVTWSWDITSGKLLFVYMRALIPPRCSGFKTEQQAGPGSGE